jgi:hypothetical protein
MYAVRPSAGALSYGTTITTDSDAETDKTGTAYTTNGNGNVNYASNLVATTIISPATETTYYLSMRAWVASMTTINLMGGVVPTRLSVVPAYFR